MEVMQDYSTDIGTHGGASVPTKDPRHMPVVHHTTTPSHHHFGAYASHLGGLWLYSRYYRYMTPALG